jgi:uncharacterized protein (TIGR04255 family)
MELKDEIYPNSPLVEVVFEIRFPGEPMVECRRHEFFARVRDEYPRVLVPQIQVPSFPALDPYQFEREDRYAGVLLAMDKFGYYTRRYPGFREFRRTFLKLAAVFGEIFNIEKLKRTGWRYINIIPFTREGGNIPLNRFLDIGPFLGRDQMDSAWTSREQYENLSITLMSRIEHCSVTTKLESIISSDQSREALLLDFDCAKLENLIFSETHAYMDESHRVARKLFETLITERYRQYLRGEVL